LVTKGREQGSEGDGASLRRKAVSLRSMPTLGAMRLRRRWGTRFPVEKARCGMDGENGIGILRCVQDDGKNEQRQEQATASAEADTLRGWQQRRATEKCEIQGSLHCAADNEAVRRFGRDDVSFGLVVSLLVTTLFVCLL
jgi:hypothetical protein